MGDNSRGATIAGGWQNAIGSNANNTTIGGGWQNFVDSTDSTVAGGAANQIEADVLRSFIGGGADNVVGSKVVNQGEFGITTNSALYGVIAGGQLNRVYGGYGVVCGGVNNTTYGDHSFVGGGQDNFAGFEGDTAGTWATVGGGFGNRASGHWSMIPGGYQNSAGGHYSFAAGRNAHADRDGCFVWADATDATVSAAAPNQFFVRASGGLDLYSADNVGQQSSLRLRVQYPGVLSWPLVISQNKDSVMTISNGGMARITLRHTGLVGIGNTNPTALLQVGTGNSNPGALLQVGNATCNGTTWDNASDRNLKENVQAIDPRQILEKVAALEVSRWNYKDRDGAKHMGPMAQDFHAAFGLGSDDKHIATVDADGVALAAIQGLNQKLEEQLERKNAEITSLKNSLRELQQQLVVIQQTLTREVPRE